VGFNGDMHIYVGFLKKGCVHLEKHAISGSYSGSNFVKFVCSCISLSGPLSLLREPWFYRNKIISTLVFPLEFFQGYLPKTIVVYVCMIWFSVSLPLDLFELNITTMYFCFVSC
jgi:hypothetical protein